MQQFRLSRDRRRERAVTNDHCRIQRKEESTHVEGLLKLFTQLKEELNLTDEEDATLKIELTEIGQKMLDLEVAFIDKVFAHGDPRGVTYNDMRTYISYIHKLRCFQLGIIPEGPTTEHPLPWLEDVDGSGYVHANFFESRSTEYGLGSLQGSVSDCKFPNLKE